MIVVDQIQLLGRAVMARTHHVSLMGQILGDSLRAMLRLSFLNFAVMAATVSQIYFTAIRALPVVLAAGMIIGLITVHYVLTVVLDYIGAYEELGGILVRVMLEEIAPLSTALIILLRSGTAIIADIALMRLNNELETLRIFGISRTNYVFLPRIIAFAVAGPSLTIVFGLVALVGSFLFLGYIHNITFASYLSQLYSGVTLRNLVVLIVKPLIICVAIAVVAIERGLCVRSSVTEVPIMLSRGMMLSIAVIILIEAAVVLFVSI